MSRTFAVFLAGICLALPLALGTACGSEKGDDDHHGDHHGDGGDHHGSHSHDEPVGPESGATCPEGSTLTYDNFGKKFFSDYCLSCHSSKVTGNARMGAPDDHDFDTVAEIDLMAEHIDQTAAFGPDSENDAMPFSGSKPTDDERKKLGEWLACEFLK